MTRTDDSEKAEKKGRRKSREACGRALGEDPEANGGVPEGAHEPPGGALPREGGAGGLRAGLASFLGPGGSGRRGGRG